VPTRDMLCLPLRLRISLFQTWTARCTRSQIFAGRRFCWSPGLRG